MTVNNAQQNHDFILSESPGIFLCSVVKLKTFYFLLVAGEQLYILNVKSQYVDKTLHVFLRTLPGNLQGPQTCACFILTFLFA